MRYPDFVYGGRSVLLESKIWTHPVSVWELLREYCWKIACGPQTRKKSPFFRKISEEESSASNSLRLDGSSAQTDSKYVIWFRFYERPMVHCGMIFTLNAPNCLFLITVTSWKNTLEIRQNIINEKKFLKFEERPWIHKNDWKKMENCRICVTSPVLDRNTFQTTMIHVCAACHCRNVYWRRAFLEKRKRSGNHIRDLLPLGTAISSAEHWDFWPPDFWHRVARLPARSLFINLRLPSYCII